MALTDRDQGGAEVITPVARDGRAPSDAGARADGAHAGPVSEATFAELIGRLINDVSDLADKQLDLAKQEIGETKDHALRTVKTLAIGAGLAAAAGLFLVIWLWTAFIWFFNWLGVRLWDPYGGVLGWILGVVVPLILAYVAFKRFIQFGINQIRAIRPLSRTRATLKEDLEWVRQLRTRSAR